MQTPLVAQKPSSHSITTYWPYLLVGTLFGFTLMKSEAASWYRIQEMFRFQSFHMYGVIGSAVVVGAIATWLLRRSGLATQGGAPIQITLKEPGMQRYIYGSVLFGIGWGLAGVCPGPIFTLVGAGLPGMFVVLLSALAGTWVYGLVRSKLPH
jgi:hypothetical protein